MKWSLVCSGIFLCLAGSVQAQGLIWSLPEDGKWVRYEGTYTQVVRRPDSAEGDLTLQWRRVTTLKSVGREEHEYQGKSQPCRWIEIKTETGKAVEGVLETGPGSVRMYRILVPESAIRGEVFEKLPQDRTVLVAFIPVVEGSRKIGEAGKVEPIKSGVFDLFPLVSLLRQYRDFEEPGDAETVQVTAGTFQAQHLKGTLTMESFTERSTNTGELSRTDEVPFGVAKWTATIVVETKGSTDDRSEFKEATTVTESMEAAATGDGAQSEFAAQ